MSNGLIIPYSYLVGGKKLTLTFIEGWKQASFLSVVDGRLLLPFFLPIELGIKKRA